ncbi:MAG: type II toxin-antitoxin system VapC family toxin [Rhizomicrobium sp.]
MVKALFDTNILVDYLNSVPQARTEIDRYHDRFISVMTWMEVMNGAAPSLEAATRSFLEGYSVVHIDDAVANESMALRRKHRIKLPDAIIWASARVHSMVLVSRNTKDFPPGDPGVRMPYRI